jgi:hypothetical protein
MNPQKLRLAACALALAIGAMLPQSGAGLASAAARGTGSAAAGPAHPTAPAGERIFATEDSLRIYVAPETTRVVARRIPLEEIIRKAQAGEQHRYDGISSLAFNRTLKVTMKYGGRKPKTRCIESVARVYFQSPDHWAEASLREDKYTLGADGSHQPWEEKDKEEPEANVTIHVDDEGAPGQARRLSEVPDYLEETSKYDFKILNRSIQPGQVLYEIGFEPRSEFDVLPGGRVWLLTNGYQIVREEYHLKNLPVPWLLKSLGLLTRDWQAVEGRWVPSRITARAELRRAVGLGLVEVPDTVEVVVVFDQYRFDVPLDPQLFLRRHE